MTESIHELDIVALARDMPEEGLTAGQTGTAVYVHNQGEAFEVEFILKPRRIIVATVERDDLLKLKGVGYSKAAG